MKNLLLRKALQFPTLIKHKTLSNFSNTESKIFLNSFPKSGTHLLSQILLSTPNFKSYNRFVRHRSSFSFNKLIQDHKIIKSINSSVNHEILLGHLKYSRDFIKVLHEANFISFFIYRDPRDLIVSEANYLCNMNKWHYLHKYFSAVPSFEDAVSLSINGLPGDFSKIYPNFYKRFAPFLSWINDESVLALKFENFFDDNVDLLLRQIKNHLLTGGVSFDADFTFSKKAIVPSNSHTYRPNGGVGSFRKSFSNKNIRDFNLVCGDLLDILNYNNF